jgi:hypothetical protein
MGIQMINMLEKFDSSDTCRAMNYNIAEKKELCCIFAFRAKKEICARLKFFLIKIRQNCGWVGRWDLKLEILEPKTVQNFIAKDLRKSFSNKISCEQRKLSSCERLAGSEGRQKQ